MRIAVVVYARCYEIGPGRCFATSIAEDTRRATASVGLGEGDMWWSSIHYRTTTIRTPGVSYQGQSRTVDFGSVCLVRSGGYVEPCALGWDPRVAIGSRVIKSYLLIYPPASKSGYGFGWVPDLIRAVEGRSNDLGLQITFQPSIYSKSPRKTAK